jgi:hypothetical protein
MNKLPFIIAIGIALSIGVCQSTALMPSMLHLISSKHLLTQNCTNGHSIETSQPGFLEVRKDQFFINNTMESLKIDLVREGWLEAAASDALEFALPSSAEEPLPPPTQLQLLVRARAKLFEEEARLEKEFAISIHKLVSALHCRCLSMLPRKC